MRIGPIDFKQPSTWRGIIGLAAIGGISVSPALAEQIALFAATAMALIEVFRNEYLAKKPPISPPISPPIIQPVTPTVIQPITRINPEPAPLPLEKGAAVSAGFDADAYGQRAADGMRNVSSHDEIFPTAGFGDR